MSSAAAHRSPRTRVSRVRVAAALMACALSVGVAGVPVAASAAGDEGDSSITVKWLNDDSRAADLQPARETTHLSPAPSTPGEITNPHYENFKNLQVTVSETEDLADQVVRIEVSGMPGQTVGGSGAKLPGSGYFPAGQNAAFQQNYLQLMQCWGDPTAADFAETCQWGAFGLDSGSLNGYNQTIAQPNLLRSEGVPFRSVQGTEYILPYYGAPADAHLLGELVTAGTSNERVAVPVKADGTASFGFEVFSSAQAPWLGCGADQNGAPRSCSLVIVPRGTVYGGSAPLQAGGGASGVEYGGTGMQYGSPIGEAFDYWDNRIVIPLDFASRAQSCDAGASGLMGGSQLVVPALTSWQKALCADADLGFSFASSADSRGREQLVQGSLNLAFTSRPAIEAELDDLSATLLADTELVYAPVAVSGVTIGFLISGQRGIRTDLTLTPRLLAKLLTQSYGQGVPQYDGAHSEHLQTASGTASPSGLFQDPEFLNINELTRADVNQKTIADVVLMGPAGSDGIRLLWDYLRADDKARAFLAGDPDNELEGDEHNSGMRINPYYLPAGDPRATVRQTEEIDTSISGLAAKTLRYVGDGAGGYLQRPVGLTAASGDTPLNLSTDAIDYLPQADQTQVPWTTSQIQQSGRPSQRFDSVSYNPYGETFATVAQRIFRGDTKRPTWDPYKNNGPALPQGGWKSEDSQLPPNVRMLGTTDTASAAEYQLSTARLQLPNRPGVYVSPTVESMTAALSARTPVAGTATAWPDLAALPDDGYPLTLVTYAAANATNLQEDAEERGDYADLIEYAAAAGQTPGTGIGDLPEGYAPLTPELSAQALDAAACLRDYDPAVGCTPPEPGQEPVPEQQSAPAAATTAPPVSNAAAASSGSAAPAAQTAYSSTVSAEATATATAEPAAGAAVGGALVAGLAGAAVAPFLLRRRPGP